MAKLTLLGDQPIKGTPIALGNFDGLHLGHRAVFAAISGQNWGVVSFAPYPRRFFDPDSPRFELMNRRVQSRLLAEIGARAHHIAFDRTVADLPPEGFLDAIGSAFAPSGIAIGADFRFGRDRTGNADILQQWGAKNDVFVAAVPILSNARGKISSTEIRNALIAGRLTDATDMLGRPHIMNGIVTQGDQRGRELGFPTANLYPDDVLLPKFGIYATRLTLHDGDHKGVYYGASSLGIRPSFGVNKPNFETFILDFDGDIYGSEISVELLDYIRPEAKFDNIDALVSQMRTDVRNIRQFLNKNRAHA